MALSNIHDVDVVSDTSSIRSVIVMPIHHQLLAPANSYLGKVWHQVVRNTLGILPNHPRGMRPHWIEIP